MLQSQAQIHVLAKHMLLRSCKNIRKLRGFRRNYQHKTPIDTSSCCPFSPRQVLNCLRAEAELGTIKLLQVNNRFERPTSDNWQDVAVGSLVLGPTGARNDSNFTNIGRISALIVSLERWDGNS